MKNFLGPAKMFGRQGINRANSILGKARRRRFLDSMVPDKPQSATRFEYSFTQDTVGYGDFFGVAFLARILNAASIEVEIKIKLDCDAQNLPEPITTIEALQLRATEFIELAGLVCPGTNVFSELVPTGAARIHRRIPPLYLLAPPPLYLLAPQLIADLYFEPLDNMADLHSCLLAAAFSPVETEKKSRYITWEIRAADYAHFRNPSDLNIVEDYRALRSFFPDHWIEVLSPFEGQERVQKIFARTLGIKDRLGQEREKVRFQKKPGFLGAMDSVIGGDFHYQRAGGGIGVVPIYAGVPHLIIADSSASHRTWGNKLMPWAEENQIFFETSRFDSYDLSRALSEFQFDEVASSLGS